MNEHVWKFPHPVKFWQDTSQVVNNNKKVLIGLAGVVSIAAFFFFRNKQDDTPLFEKKLIQMNVVEENAVQQMSRLQYVENMDRAAVILQDSTLPEWQNFQQQISSTKRFRLDKDLVAKRQLLIEYADLRVQQSTLLYKAFKENTNAYDSELSVVYNDINGILDKLQH